MTGYIQRIAEQQEEKQERLMKGIDVIVSAEELNQLRQSLADAQAERDEMRVGIIEVREAFKRVNKDEPRELIDELCCDDVILHSAAGCIDGLKAATEDLHSQITELTQSNQALTAENTKLQRWFEGVKKAKHMWFQKARERGRKVDVLEAENTRLKSELADYRAERNCKACGGSGGQRDSSEPDANEEPCDACLGSGSQLVADEFAERLAMIEGDARQDAIRDTWLPIKTAPKDGSRILTFEDQYAEVGYWDRDEEDEGGQCWRRIDMDNEAIRPTHWMPLPAPPTSALIGQTEGEVGE